MSKRIKITAIGPRGRQTKQISEVTKQAIVDIKDIQMQLDSLTLLASEEVLQIDKKYNELRQPCYDKRALLFEKIPKFWKIALLNHRQLSVLFDNQKEADCLDFLKKLEVEDFENMENGYRIMFVFDDNPFFENAELIKEIKLRPTSEAKSTSTKIKWKKGMDLKKKLRGNFDGKRKRGLKEITFFDWFSDNQDPSEDPIAEMIKSDLWADPLQYYLMAGVKGKEEEEEEPEITVIDEAAEEDDDEDDDMNSPDKTIIVISSEEDENN